MKQIAVALATIGYSSGHCQMKRASLLVYMIYTTVCGNPIKINHIVLMKLSMTPFFLHDKL